MSIRLALGATRGQILGLILKQGITNAVIGTAVGLAGAYWLARLLSPFVFGISGADPAVLGGVALVLLVASLAACYVPGRRASRVHPADVLRMDE